MLSRLAPLLFILAGATAAPAQYDPVPRNLPYDGRFTFARLRYAVANGGYYYRGLPAWAHGYSHAEENLMKITHEVSLINAHLDGSNVIAIDDPELFRYPVSYMTEAGYWVLTDAEIVALRKYVLKGGFLILDDTRDGFSPGNMGWANIQANFKRIFPELSFVDLTRAHPIFHSFFDIESLDVVRQTTTAARWRSARCSTRTIRRNASWCWSTSTRTCRSTGNSRPWDFRSCPGRMRRTSWGSTISSTP